MPNIRLIIEYDGARFFGWQIQPGLRTIEGELKHAVETVLREEIHAIYASGRTDAGVHARGQVVNFICHQVPDLNRLLLSVSSIMKGDLRVLSADFVDDSFNARRSARAKQYTYTVFNHPAPPVLDRGRVWYVSGRLDVERMKVEAASLVGKYDFTSFRASGCTARSPLKEIFESEVRVEGAHIFYRVVGDGFLKQMVRTIAGTLVGFGQNYTRLGSMSEIIESRDRQCAGVTAPGYGLCLDWVRYA